MYFISRYMIAKQANKYNEKTKLDEKNIGRTGNA